VEVLTFSERRNVAVIAAKAHRSHYGFVGTDALRGARAGMVTARAKGGSMEPQKWMSNLVIVRHAESQRNVAKGKAEAAGVETYGGGIRDVDILLTDQGHQQADQTGRKLREHLGFDFDRVFSSPYQRTVQTAMYFLARFERPPEVVLEERIRSSAFWTA
jgi:hypothetical protein